MTRQIAPLVPALRRYAVALLRDRTAADDLVQDCLERAISHWHRRRGEGEPRAWLFAILHNLAMTRLRRRASRPGMVPLEDAGEDALAHPPAQEDGLHVGDVRAALARLPEAQRTVLLLVAVEDLSYAEAARVLAIPVGTVMSRLSRARERLHREMTPDRPPANEAAHLRRVK